MEPNLEGGAEDYLPEPPLSNVETWLVWQASKLTTLTWWLELKAIPGVKDLWKLAHKIWASFSIPEVRMRATPGQGYTAPPAPTCLNRNAFLPDDLLYQDVWQQPVLLTITYARGLQYWAEKHNPPENPDSHPLAGGVPELGEAVREYITFTNWEVFWGLGADYQGATNQWPQATLVCQILLLPGNKSGELDTGFTEDTIQTAPPAIANVDMARCTTPPFGMERENHYLLVITASIEQLNLGPDSDIPDRCPNDSPRGNTFLNPWMAAVFSGSTKEVGHGGATMKELK